MSLEINNISTNNSINSAQINKSVAFKTNPIPQDSVELSSKKKGLSAGAKIEIGVGAATVIGFGIYKRKSLKNLWEGVNKKIGKGSKKPPKEPIETGNKPKGVNEGEKPKRVGEEKPPTTGTSSLPHAADFKNINEAKEYFESIGVKTVFKPGAESHLEDLNSFKRQFALMEQNGVAMPKPDTIIIADWHNQNEMREISNALHMRDRAAELDRIGLWGTVERGENGKLYVIINSKFGNFKDITHEMGHLHQDLEKNYWNNKGLLGKDFMNKQLEILGIPNPKINPNVVDGFYRREHNPSILRHPCFHNDSQQNVEFIKQYFPELEKQDIYKVFSITTEDGKKYLLNAKKLVDKMHAETRTYEIGYSNTYTWEQAATMFSRLNNHRPFSDEVLLMYDFIGGGRVPNLVIKGKKYDDYIESLYNNPDLIRKLRESIEVKEFV